MKLKLLLFILLFGAAFAAQAQPLKKWNGSVSTNWSTAANWTPAVVPVAGDSVRIDNLSGQNQPVITSGTAAKAKNIYVGVGNQLTINAGGELELASTLNVTAMGIVSGTVTNNGTLKIKSGFQGIDVFGTFINNGAIQIGEPASSPYSIGEEGIRVGTSGNSFTNNSTGTIVIRRTSNNGILLNLAGTSFTNYGSVTVLETGLSLIPAVAGTGDGIDARGGVFVNETTGNILITKVSANGFNCRNAGGSVTNKGQITIRNVGLTPENELREGINNSASFTNAAGGQITIDTTGNNGILNQGTFANSGNITIGANTINNFGLVNNGAFNNYAVMNISNARSGVFSGGFGGVLTNFNTGNIAINGMEEDGIFIFGLGGVDNRGTIQIGNNSPVGRYGINNATQFINQSTASLTILNTGSASIYNVQDPGITFIKPTFLNAGQIAIGNQAGAASTVPGITNTAPARFANLDCGVLTTYQHIASADSFHNYAFLMTLGSAAHDISGTFINDGVIHDPNGTFDGITLTNNDFIVQEASGECTISNALTKGTGANVAIAGTWYKDQTLTMVAGTYNQAANTFTVTNLNEGTHTLYFRATDSQFGCSRVFSIKVTYNDVTPPSITCPADQTVAASANCSGTVGAWPAVAVSDNCGTATVNQSPASSTVLNGHNATQTVTLTANDGRGNTNQCTFKVTLKDVTPPSITCPADQTVAADGNCSGTVGAWPAVAASDNCGTPAVSQSPAPATVLIGHNTAQTVTLTATDGNSNSAQCSFTLTLKDVTPPSVVCPAPVTISCAAQVPPVSLNAVSAADNCSIPSKSHVGDDIANQTCPNRFTVTRTYRATDAVGLSATCTQVITVFDNTAPNFSIVPANVTVQCNSVPAPGSAAATDGCDGTVSVVYDGQTISGQTCTDSYIITRQWTATDACGNTRTASQRITVQDTQRPLFTSVPANVTVQCHNIPPAGAVTATDNCDTNVSVVYDGETRTNGACPDSYTLTRKWTASDNCGNTRTVTQRITVRDTQKPEFTSVPQNVTIECTETAPAPGSASATDNCDSDVTIAYLGQSSVSLGCVNHYRITRTWRATDNCGNWTTATQTITVQDTQAPAFTSVPAHLTIECSDLVPPIGQATATDACGGYVHVTFLGHSSSAGDCSQEYVLTRSWRATDECGNAVTATQTITVADTQAPVFNNAPANLTLACGAALPTVPIVTASDNCDNYVPVTYLGEENDGPGCPYTVTRTWEVADDCSNVRTHTQVITVGGQSFGGNGADMQDEATPADDHAGLAAGHRSDEQALPVFGLLPNPARDAAWINSSRIPETGFAAALYDPAGRLIRQYAFAAGSAAYTHRLDLTGLPTGVYYVQITGQGIPGQTLKLVVRAD